MRCASTNKASPNNLVMDVGGTNVRLGLASQDGGLIQKQKYPWTQVSSLSDAIGRFCADCQVAPRFRTLVVAFAGPIVAGMEVFAFTNAAQSFSRQELAAFADEVRVVNDFVAQAALVARVETADTWTVKGGTANRKAARAIVGPGTGLGVCAISDKGHLLPSEGGNTALPYLPAQADLIGALGPRDTPWRIEDVLSGPGIERVYRALGGAEIRAKASDISKAATAGEPTAMATLKCFFDYLALTCANQALQYSAAGGVFIVANIVNHNRALLDRARFGRIFTSIESHAAFLAQVPVTLITRQGSGLEGAAVLASDRL